MEPLTSSEKPVTLYQLIWRNTSGDSKRCENFRTLYNAVLWGRWYAAT